MTTSPVVFSRDASGRRNIRSGTSSSQTSSTQVQPFIGGWSSHSRALSSLARQPTTDATSRFMVESASSVDANRLKFKLLR